jgi:hypothetical protein
MTSSSYLRTQRIRLICKILDRKGACTLVELLDDLNSRLQEAELEKIGVRTLQKHIEYLRNGDFGHSKSGLPLKQRQKLFRIECFERNKYRWSEGSERPEFGDLEEDERFTVPFLKGILRKYESLPAVRKVIDKLPEIFSLSDDEMDTSSAVVHNGPQLFRDQLESSQPKWISFQEAVVTCVVRILSLLHQQKVIEFNYFDVNRGNFNYIKVVPLQIRYYENYYYLLGCDTLGKKLLSFRVDQIDRLKVDIATEEDDDHEIGYPSNIEEVRDRLNKSLSDSLGVWLHNVNEPVYKVSIRFTNWAAAYMRNLKFHHSQTIEQDDKVKQEIVVSFKLRLARPVTAPEQVLEQNKELAFLIKRFREYAEVIDYIPQ